MVTQTGIGEPRIEASVLKAEERSTTIPGRGVGHASGLGQAVPSGGLSRITRGDDIV